MQDILLLAQDPAAWVALVTLVVMEVVLGIDNLIFISILTNKLPVEHREKARRIGIALALVMRLALLGTVAWIVKLTTPVFEAFGHGFSWKDMILIAGGLFLVWKATKEIHHNVDPADHGEDFIASSAINSFGAAIAQISNANAHSVPTGNCPAVSHVAPNTTHASRNGVPSSTCVHAPRPPMRPTHAANA